MHGSNGYSNRRQDRRDARALRIRREVKRGQRVIY